MSATSVISSDPDQLVVRSSEDFHLRGSCCTECSTYFFPRRWECAIDQAPCVDVELSDVGTLHVSTWVNKPSYGKAEVETEGFAVGQIDLPEGPRIQAVLVGGRSWEAGDAVKLATETVGIDGEGREILAYRFSAALHDVSEPNFQVGLLASEAAARWPDRVFTVLADGELTFGELSRWVDAIAADLIGQGVVAGDKVLVHLPNGYEVLIFQLAAWRIGAIAVPVVPIYRTHELAFIVAAVSPRVIVTVPGLSGREPHKEFDAILAGAGLTASAKYLVGGSAAGWRATPAMPSATDSTADLPDAGQADDCCLILFTSGTTSAPKGAMLTSRSAIEATTAWLNAGIGFDDVAYAVAPLAHIAGLIPGGLLPLMSGCRAVIATRWNPDEAVEVIHRHKATFSCGAAVFLQDLVDRYAVAGPELHRLRYFVSGGSPTPPALIKRAEEVGIHATRAYGMTETAGVITLASATEDLDRRANFDGKLVEGIEVSIVGDDGTQLPDGEEGSIRIRGTQVMLGYTDPIVTAEQLVDRWFEPGDVGLVTSDRWVRITGRTKDIINRGGEKFSARDIEEAILSHSSVSRVAVTSVPHVRLGEAVGAWVVLDVGTAWKGPDALLNHLDSIGLAKAKFPTTWTVVEALPMTASGKVQKQLLELNDGSVVN